MRREQTLLLRDVIDKMIKENGLEEGLMAAELFSIFDSIVGSSIAARIESRRFFKGVIYCTICSSVIKSQLFMQRELIVNKINAKLGKQVVKSIIFK